MGIWLQRPVLSRRAEATIRSLVSARIRFRRELVESVPELASARQLDALAEEIDKWIETHGNAILADVARHYGGDTKDEVDAQYRVLAEALVQIRSAAKIELSILKNESDLGLRRQRSGVVLNLQGSNVGAVNFGTVMGDLRAVVKSLENQGSTDLAARLRSFSEAAESSQDLGERRGQILESLAEIGEQATNPRERRRASVVAALVGSIIASLAAAPSLLPQWRELETMIRDQFDWNG